MRKLIKASEIYCEDKILKNGGLVINDGLIEDIGTSFNHQEFEIIDLTGYKVIPGLIDLHIHGANGYDTMDASYEALNEISKYLAENGVTAFLPTTITADWERIMDAVINVKKTMEKGVEGASIIGSYIEGPFITEKKKGAHPSELIRKLNYKDIDELLKNSKGSIRVITIAPEKEGSNEVIKYLTTKGLEVSLGHTDATFAQIKEAVQDGASIAVHVFNGMKGMHHREPGVVGAVLTIDEIYAELIADTIHVHPEVMKVLVKCKGVDKVCLISDCMMAGGLEDGEYKLGELEVFVKDSISRLRNGSLAGSTLKLIDGVKNMIEKVGVDPLDAVHMASFVPAKILGIDNEIGSIRKNKRATLTIVDDEYNVIMTMIDGNIVYESK